MASGGNLPVASMTSREWRAAYWTRQSFRSGRSVELKYLSGDSSHCRLDRSPRIRTLMNALSVFTRCCWPVISITIIMLQNILTFYTLQDCFIPNFLQRNFDKSVNIWQRQRVCVDAVLTTCVPPLRPPPPPLNASVFSEHCVDIKH